MSTLRSSVLLIGHPAQGKVSFGADFAHDFDRARKALVEFNYPVIALPSSSESGRQALELLEFANSAAPYSQRVIIQNDSSIEILRQIVNTGSIFRILPSFDDPRFELTIQEALEEHNALKQNVKLLQLVNEQNDRLKRLTTDLEERVEARRKSLDDAKGRLLITNHRVEALHRALVAIHRAGSIGEMERLVNDALSEALGLSWTRILFQTQARIEGASSSSRSLGGPAMFASKLVATHSAPLTRGRETLGQIYFARPSERPFTRDENGFLGQVADAVSLAIDRLTKLEESETLKHQWEATFDAILEPVSLITNDFTVIRINRAFADGSGTDPEKIIGRKCHEALFGRTTPCEGCALVEGLQAHFRLKPSRTTGGQNVIFDVFSQEIQFKPEDRLIFVNMYHDVSSQLRAERQILESAKMVELGTIGSSIAHELNNPLGGMLSFLQLIKMDISDHRAQSAGGKDEPWYDDIDEMEKGARRCRDIVQSLLGFTRKSSVESTEVIDLREVVDQALKITELQTRAMGITVVRDLSQNRIGTRGQFNSLAQAIRNFLQNAQEAIAEKARGGDRTPGEIRVRVNQDAEWATVEIVDNGAGFDAVVADQIYDPLYTTKDPVNNPGLGLNVAQQIINDHGGKMQIASARGSGTTVKISFITSETESL